VRGSLPVSDVPRGSVFPVELAGASWARFSVSAILVGLLSSGPLAGLPTQSVNLLHAPEEVERRLGQEAFEVLRRVGSRFEGDRTQQATLRFGDGERMLVKWARAPLGGEAYNNRPQYEVAAYRLQKLFLDPEDYVVPPTVARCFPVEWYRNLEPRVVPTFRDARDVLVVLQYWLWNVSSWDGPDRGRIASDTLYARRVANFNLLTYLIRHNDANEGNYLVSEDSTDRRLFVVDNGLSFGWDRSDRGHHWRELRVDRLPRETVERLRRLDEELLNERLGIVAHFEERNGHLIPVLPGHNLNPGKGMRRDEGVLQMGLAEGEISRVWERIRQVLERVDRGEIALF